MIIHMNIANGYRVSRIKKIIDDIPGIQPVDATRQFVTEAYCGWIDRNLPDAEHLLVDVTEDSFKIDFLNDTDAMTFRNKIGGRVVEE